MDGHIFRPQNHWKLKLKPLQQPSPKRSNVPKPPTSFAADAQADPPRTGSEGLPAVAHDDAAVAHDDATAREAEHSFGTIRNPPKWDEGISKNILLTNMFYSFLALQKPPANAFWVAEQISTRPVGHRWLAPSEGLLGAGAMGGGKEMDDSGRCQFKVELLHGFPVFPFNSWIVEFGLLRIWTTCWFASLRWVYSGSVRFSSERRVGANLRRNIEPSEFRRFYDRNDLPIQVSYRAKRSGGKILGVRRVRSWVLFESSKERDLTPNGLAASSLREYIWSH